MKNQPKQIFGHKQQIDMDPYSTTILDQLLDNDQQWTSSDQIIKLTFKAMGDILKTHSQSIKDIKSVLTTRASKTQLTTGLSLKANVSDISQAIDQISAQIQDRLSYNDLNKILKEYIHRSEMAKALSEKHFQQKQKQKQKQLQQQDLIKSQTQTQLQTQFQTNQNQSHEIDILTARINQFQKQIAKQMTNYVYLNEFKEALNIIDAKVNTKDFNQVIQNYVSKQHLSQCLQKKVNKTDLQPLLDSKADAQDLQYIVNSLQTKVNLTTLQKLTQVIENKADKSDLMMIINEKASLNKSHHRSIIEDNSQKYESLRLQMSTMVSQLRQKLEVVSQNYADQTNFSKKLTSLSTQVHQSFHLLKLDQSKAVCQLRLQYSQSINSIKSQLKSLNEELLYRNSTKTDTFTRQLTNQINLRKRCEQKIYQQINQVRKKIDQLNMKQFQKSQLINLKNDLLNLIDRKVQKQQLTKAISQATSQISRNFQMDNQTNTLLLQKLQKTYSEAISTNSNDILKISKSLSKKQDKFQFSIIEESIRKTRKQIQDCRKTVDKSYQELQSKLSISQYQNDLLQIKKRFDKLFKQMEGKANIKDVCVLADSKPNIDDVNNALKQINQALNQKIAETQLQNILKDQSAINQTLCSENIIGRWMWQSGDIRAGGLVPWEVESANTVPQHFFWQKDKTSVLILAPGIYEIQACVFNRNSLISILVNGQNIDMPKGDQNSNTINNMRNKSMSQGKKKGKGKDIDGNKVQHLVLLPARSRVSLMCLGDVGEGFLNIKRL